MPFYAGSLDLKNLYKFQYFQNCFIMGAVYMLHYDIITTSVYRHISNVSGLHYFKQD